MKPELKDSLSYYALSCPSGWEDATLPLWMGRCYLEYHGQDSEGDYGRSAKLALFFMMMPKCVI